MPYSVLTKRGISHNALNQNLWFSKSSLRSSQADYVVLIVSDFHSYVIEDESIFYHFRNSMYGIYMSVMFVSYNLTCHRCCMLFNVYCIKYKWFTNSIYADFCVAISMVLNNASPGERKCCEIEIFCVFYTWFSSINSSYYHLKRSSEVGYGYWHN